MGAGASDLLMAEPGDDPIPSSEAKLALLPLIREFYDRGNLWLYLYMSELWKLQQRGWEDKQLPPAERRLWPIVPLVFYTGEGTWSTPIGLKHLMDLPAELERYVPTWETPLLCLHET